MRSTNDVLDHHLKAIEQGDVGGVLSDYAPDGVLFRQDGAFKGLDAIRPVFQKFVAEFRKPGTTTNTKQRLVAGDYAYMVWTAETADNVYELATDTFIVGEGKIVAQSFYRQDYFKEAARSQRQIKRTICGEKASGQMCWLT